MAGPMISGAASKALAEVAKQMATQGPEATKAGASKFDAVMSEAMQKHGIQDTQPVSQAVELNKSGKLSGIGTVQQVLRGVEVGQMQLDKIMDLALSGKQFTTQELLTIQMGVYRFTQELELTSKVIEQATSGIKTTMQTQV